MANKYLDYNGLLFFWTKIQSLFVAAGTAITSLKVNGTPQTITGGVVDVTVPTKVSSLDNDSEFQTASDVTNAISNAIGEMTGLEFVKLADGQYDTETGVPTITGAAGKIYLTKNSGSAPNQYDEYIWLATDNSFEKIGTTAVDLSGYLLSSDMVAVTNDEIETMLTT